MEKSCPPGFAVDSHWRRRSCLECPGSDCTLNQCLQLMQESTRVLVTSQDQLVYNCWSVKVNFTNIQSTMKPKNSDMIFVFALSLDKNNQVFQVRSNVFKSFVFKRLSFFNFSELSKLKSLTL